MFKKVNRIFPVILFIAVLSISSTGWAIYSADTLVSMTNQERAQNGVASLNTNQALTNAAQAKVNDMFANQYFAHNSPSGKTPWDFIHEAGYNFTYAGENLAIGYFDATDLMNAWMNSPSHRENILNPNFQDIGIAVVAGTYEGVDTIIAAQEFGSTGQSQVQSAQSSTTPATPTPTPSPSSQPSFSILPDQSKINPTSIFAGEEVQFTAAVSGEVKTLDVTLGNLKFSLLDDKNAVSQGNTKTYTIKENISAVGKFAVTLTAKDQAGNEKSVSLGSLEVKPVVITNNSTKANMRFAGFSSTASMVGTFVLAGALMAAIVYLILRRNKLQKLAKASLATWEF